MMQRGLKEGVLVTWTKSFACPDGVGEDVVRLLEEAIAKRGVNSQIISKLSISTTIVLHIHQFEQN